MFAFIEYIELAVGKRCFRARAHYIRFTTKKNSMALVRERTILTERPPPVGEVSANFCG